MKKLVIMFIIAITVVISSGCASKNNYVVAQAVDHCKDNSFTQYEVMITGEKIWDSKPIFNSDVTGNYYLVVIENDEVVRVNKDLVVMEAIIHDVSNNEVGAIALSTSESTWTKDGHLYKFKGDSSVGQEGYVVIDDGLRTGCGDDIVVDFIVK